MTYQKSLQIEEIARKLKPLFGKKIDQLYFQYSTSDSFEEKNEITQVLTSLYQKHLNQLLDDSVLLEPPKKESIEGEYPLAKVVYADKELFDFSLREQDWPRHVCISGMSGSGKTTFALNILKKFSEKNKPFLVFDWKKSFRPLMNIDPSIACFTVGNEKVSNLFKTNINRPPKGVAPREWINVLCDLLTESFQVSFGVHKILLETLDEIFEGWEIYKLPEEKRHYPNWMHVKKMLELKAKNASGRESKWYESALRIASVLTFGEFGKTINYDGKKSLSIEDLFDKRVILELNSLGNIEKKFFCEFILTYIYKLKKSGENKVDEGFNYAIVVDEAHNIFLKDKTHFVAESITDMVYREMREYGISLVCLDQHISKISDTVKGNSACHIAFQQQLPQDLYDISALMQLTDKKEIFSKLPVGTAVVKLSERHTSPFLIKAPLINLRKETISDEKIASKTDCIVKGVQAEKEPEFLDSITFEREVEKGKWGDSKIEASMQGTEYPTSPQNKSVTKESKESKPIFEFSIEKSLLAGEMSQFSYEVPKSKIKIVKQNFTDTQKVLYDFVGKQIELGKDLKEIESNLEKGLLEKCYSESDVLKVINYSLKNQLHNEETSGVDLSGLSEQEKSFMNYLLQNPGHEKSTVEFYKQVGLSTRKGNIVKNDLMYKGFIKIDEVKYSKGWKKLIRSNNIQTTKQISLSEQPQIELHN
jgi:Helicase HerA, central domain